VTHTLEALLNQLDQAKNRFGPQHAKRVSTALRRLAKQTFSDAESLFRFHEILLFLRAYPQSPQILQLVERELSRIPERVKALRESEIDLTAFDDPEVSGICGTSVTDTFSYFIVCWLMARHPAQIRFDWDWFEDENRLAETWPRFMPLLEEDAWIEANVPYRKWLAAARKGRSELAWLVDRFNELPKPDKERAELYDSQQLYVRWTPAFRASRTGLRSPVRKVFYHRGPLIQRRDIDLRKEMDELAPKNPIVVQLRGTDRRANSPIFKMFTDYFGELPEDIPSDAQGTPRGIIGSGVKGGGAGAGGWACIGDVTDGIHFTAEFAEDGLCLLRERRRHMRLGVLGDYEALWDALLAAIRAA